MTTSPDTVDELNIAAYFLHCSHFRLQRALGDRDTDARAADAIAAVDRKVKAAAIALIKLNDTLKNNGL